MENLTQRLAEILSEIPIKSWHEIVQQEPEFVWLRDYFEKYGFSKFAVLMTAAGLNDFQLKGKAEHAYWPVIRKTLDKYDIPESLEELEEILVEFYKNERLPKLKLKRLNRFLSSNLASRLWKSEPEDIERNFLQIWEELAYLMRQDKEAKTVVFAMKCLGISLIMAGKKNFNFEKIPIPIDSRVKKFTKRIGKAVSSDQEVREFWNRVIEEIRKRNLEINMIHLDSLIWQIGVLSKREIKEYFEKFGLIKTGEKIIEVMKE